MERATYSQLFHKNTKTVQNTHLRFQGNLMGSIKHYSEHSKSMRICGEPINIIDMIKRWSHFFANARRMNIRDIKLAEM